MGIVPNYHRVYLELRDRILDGSYDTDVPMPGEQKLSRELDVSRGTVRRALALLEDEGLVSRRQGARTYATPLSFRAAHKKLNLDLLPHENNYLEIFPGEIDQRFEVVAASKELMKQFPGEKQIGRVVRVRESNNKPYCFVVTYMPLTIAECIDWEQLGTTPVITAVASAGYDFVKTEQVITATTAGSEAAAALDVPAGSPVLRVSGLFIGGDGNAVMRKDGYFHPEGFEYRTTLYKDS